MKPERSTVFVCGVVALFPATSLFARSSASQRETPPAVAFQNVQLISMEKNGVETGQTVIVERGVIVAIGRAGDLAVPTGAVVIDGAGRYLLPGLTDAHVHLESWMGVRRDFGDAPLYLASGVTSVVNLRGTPTFLDWKRRVEAGDLEGPTIYTTGEFLIGPWGPALRQPSGALVVGPNVESVESVEQEVTRQVQLGVDAIKFYGGLPRHAYLRMTEAARNARIPVVGHRPITLGIKELLEGRQALAHVYMLSNLYFWPVTSNRPILLVNAAALLLLVVCVVAAMVAKLMGGGRSVTHDVALARARVRRTGLAMLLGGAIALLLQLDIFLFARIASPWAILILFAIVAGFIAATTIAAGIATLRVWQHRKAPGPTRANGLLTTAAGLGLCAAMAGFWVPMAWRTTDRGLEHLGRQLHAAGIPAQTTLVAFAVLASPSDQLRQRQGDPALEHLAPAIRDGWRALPAEAPAVPPWAMEFMKRVTAALHRAGVLLVAGTDALGAPFVVPGVSLHQELQLLTECGLTPFEALRTATVNPAVFLGREKEFGTVAVGKRADLVLVERNPLEDLSSLKQPIGVMSRGHWWSRDVLQQKLSALRAGR